MRESVSNERWEEVSHCKNSAAQNQCLRNVLVHWINAWLYQVVWQGDGNMQQVPEALAAIAEVSQISVKCMLIYLNFCMVPLTTTDHSCYRCHQVLFAPDMTALQQ